MMHVSTKQPFLENSLQSALRLGMQSVLDAKPFYTLVDRIMARGDSRKRGLAVAQKRFMAIYEND